MCFGMIHGLITGLTHAGRFGAGFQAFWGLAWQAKTGSGNKKPSVDAAVDLITLNQKVQVGQLPGLQAFRTMTNMHNSIQTGRPEVIN